VVLIAVCSLTYLFVERPMQEVGRRVGRRPDARFGPDRTAGRMVPGRAPALAGHTHAAAD
jgi:peptidoglycan/LPS O-acetylase OafA/YrhL